jgi:hypothetical protein
MRLFLLAALVVVACACDKPAAQPIASSWTLRVTSMGVPLGTTPIKVTFLQNAQPVGSAEGSTDVNGEITMPVLISAGGRADRAKIVLLDQEPVEVAFGAATVDVGALVGGEAPPPEQRGWTVKLTSKGAPLANTKVSVTLLQRVQCVAAPCNPQQVGNVDVTTDADGNASIPVGASLMGKPDRAELTVAGHAPVSAGVGAATVDVP